MKRTTTLPIGTLPIGTLPIGTLLIGLVLLVAACGGAAGSPTTTTSGTGSSDTTTTTVGDSVVPPVDPESVVLRIHHEGGFVPVEMAYHPMPTYALFGDGRLIAPGMIPLIYPGPLLPAVQVIQLDEVTVSQIMELVNTMGLADLTDERLEDATNIADASDTVFTYFGPDGEHRLAVYALGAGESDDPLVRAAGQLIETLDAASASGEPLGDYEPEAVEVLASPSFDAENEAGAEVVAWPLPVGVADMSDIGGETGVRCLALEGEEAQAALAVFAESTQATFFEEAGEVWRLNPRPLFPGETGCP